MDADAHQRAGDEAKAKISYWHDQISLAEQEFNARVQSFKNEMANEEKKARDHYEQAQKLRIQAEHDKDKRDKIIEAGIHLAV